MKRLAIVTGAAGGIGKAVCDKFRQDGWDVVGVDIETDCGIGRYDVSDPGAVRELFQKIKGGRSERKALVNCAGAIEFNSIPDTTLQDWNLMLQHNLTTAFVMTREFAKFGLGTIVNVSSVNATLSSEHRVGYAAAKGGIEAFTRISATQLGPNIRVNCVALGPIQTRQANGLSRRNVLGRIGLPVEAADPIVWLCGDGASYITGATLAVDGGYGLI